MRMQSSPALSLKFTFCFAFSEKESGFAQPTITFAAAWRFHSVKIENLAFRWNCLIKDREVHFHHYTQFKWHFCTDFIVVAWLSLCVLKSTWIFRYTYGVVGLILDKSTILKRRKPSLFIHWVFIHKHFIRSFFLNS